MFFLNSEDLYSVPDSLFFLHKIGLLKHTKSDLLPCESLYYFKNGRPEVLWTPDSIGPQIETPQTILVFDFVSDCNLNRFKGHDLIVIPHVYFDYVKTIKIISETCEPNSYKIFSPQTKNTTLIPKKYLLTTLPFLAESNFATHIVAIDSPEPQRKNLIRPSSALDSVAYFLTKSSMIFLFFVLKPMTTTRLFFSKYNFMFVMFVAGSIRVGLIKLGYALLNIIGSFRVFVIKFFWFNYNYTLYPVRKLIWVLEHEFKKRVLAKLSHARKN